MDVMFPLDAGACLGKRVLRRVCFAVFFTTVLGVGLWLRSLPTRPVPASAWPWAHTKIATLYFRNNNFFFPVSRRITTESDLPRAAIQALFAGPSADSGLTSSIPPGLTLREFRFADGVAHVDLSSEASRDTEIRVAETAIVQTLTALPGVSSVVVSVNGQAHAGPAPRAPMLYYASANGLAGLPATAADPRSALTEYLSGPPDSRLSGLPRDVHLLSYQYESGEESLSLNFSYTPSLHTLAIERPDRMRTVLLGLIATLTEWPNVRAVQLDFEGHTRLGLGQCGDLLRTPQPHPTLLNDERLLGR